MIIFEPFKLKEGWSDNGDLYTETLRKWTLKI
jgi:hypothetical protein